MKIIINSNSMIPIYEQIMDAIKKMITTGELRDGDPLPSVRTLSKELKISALTVKKAYDNLEAEGFTATVHGKGTYVFSSNKELLVEEQRKQIEKEMEAVIHKAENYGLTARELHELIDLLMEENDK